MTKVTNGSDLRVSIVDDDAGAAAIHARHVDALSGMSVQSVVRSGEDAVEAIRSQKLDLVILELHLPDISGFEVLHRLNGEARSATDVFVLSSASDRTCVGQALAAGVVDYVVKPVSGGELERRLRAYQRARGERPSDARSARPTPLDQPAIDAMVAAQAVPPGPSSRPMIARLPKGLSETTAQRVLDCVPADEARPAAWIAVRAGVSRITARRYLELMRVSGVVELSLRYGVPGRPEQRFKRVRADR